MRAWAWIALFLAVMAGRGVAQANTPLMVVVNGNLYRLNGVALEPYSACQPPERIINAPFMSANNQHFVLQTMPQALQAFIDQFGGLGGGELPSNLWLCDHLTQQLIPIAMQSPTFAVNEGALADSVLHSTPAWSADGTQVAWVQTVIEVASGLIVFEVPSPTRQGGYIADIATQLPPQAGIPSSPLVYWLNGFITLISNRWVDANLSQVATEAYLYHPTNPNPLTVTSLNLQAEGADFITNIQPVWVSRQHDYLLVDFFDAGLVAIHPATGERHPVNSALVLQATSDQRDNALVYEEREFVPTWLTNTYINPQGQPDGFSGMTREQMALAPDGTTLAFWTDQLRLWSFGEYGAIENTFLGDNDQAFAVWGATRWTIDTDEFKTPVCPNSLPTWLYRGSVAVLNVGETSNNLRRSPTREATVVGQLDANIPALVLGSPICADGFAWLLVQLPDGNLGWTVQGDSAKYWVIPPETQP